MIRYEDIIVQLDANIERALERQITDETSRDRGGFGESRFCGVSIRAVGVSKGRYGKA